MRLLDAIKNAYAEEDLTELEEEVEETVEVLWKYGDIL